MSMDFLKDFLAGGTSGAIAKTLTAPIERVKLIIQTQDANPRIISGEIPRYTGIINCVTRVASEQGLRTLWRGNFVNILRYFPTQAFNFAFNDSIKRQFPARESFIGKLCTNVASGGLAGVGSLSIVYPLDYARTRLAADVGSGKRAFNGLTDCIYKTATGPSGIIGLYSGYGASVVGIIPFRGTYFGVNDTLITYNPYQQNSDLIGLASKYACAQTAAISAAYASYPFDTVRRRLQMQSGTPKSEWVYKGTFDCFSRILKDEGPTAFFKGAGANVLRTLGSALVLVMYGEIKKMVN